MKGKIVSHIPTLEPYCGSWIVSRKDNGEVVGEFYSRKLVEQLIPSMVVIETAAKYLGRINTEIRKATA